jgi:large subunit ribosomal protein L23
MNATKQMVKDAIETSFDVDVLRVNIINVPAKRSRRWRNRRVKVRRSAYKKAIITLGPDERIDVFEGVR